METLMRPQAEAEASVYSNYDHRLDADVAQHLENHPGEVFAQHAAWNFCGYVWRQPDGRWVDQVWQWNAPVEDIFGDTIEDVIRTANEGYGYQ